MFKKATNKKSINTIRLIIIVLCEIVFLYSAYKLVNLLIIEPYQAKSESLSIHPSSTNFTITNDDGALVISPDDFEDKVDENGILISMKQAVEANSDVKGWLVVPNSIINYPVMQAANNDYYLHRGLDKKYLGRGSLFLDASIKITKNITDNYNYVIYGHNMKNGTMFRDLLKYSKVDFYKENAVISFDTIYESSKWVVFSVMKCNVNEAKDEVFEFYRTNFDGDADFNSFLEAIKSRSLIKTGIDVNVNDTLLTLQTCSYEYDDIRTVVVARRVRDDEKIID